MTGERAAQAEDNASANGVLRRKADDLEALASVFYGELTTGSRIVAP